MTTEQLNAAINNLPSKNTNVTTSLLRIKGLRDLLAQIGSGLGLNTDNATLELIVIEYNKIVKKEIPEIKEGSAENGAITVDNKHLVLVDPGYYPKGFVVTGSNSLDDQDAAIKQALENLKKEIQSKLPDPADVVAGSTVPVIISKSGTNELEIRYVEGLLGTPYTGLGGENDNRVTAGDKDLLGNVVIKSAAGKSLSSNIPYYEGGDQEVKVTISTTANDETIVETAQLPSGYYASQVTVKPVVELGESTNKVVNVEANKNIPITRSGNIALSPSNGFDFISSGTIQVPDGSSKVVASSQGNAITLTPTTREGWITETEISGAQGTTITKNEDGTYTIVLNTNTTSDSVAIAGSDDIDSDNKRELVVTIPEGVYAEGTTLPVKLNGDTIEYLTSIGDVIEREGTYEIVVPPGIISTHLTKDLGKSTITISTSAVETDTTETISSKVTHVSTSEGYTKGEGKNLTIIDASTPELVAKKVTDSTSRIIINIAKGGWAEGETDVTEAFEDLANQYANGLVDLTGGIDVADSKDLENGQVLFTYNDNLDEVSKGILVKIPNEGRFFTSAKVDLSALILDIDEI